MVADARSATTPCIDSSAICPCFQPLPSEMVALLSQFLLSARHSLPPLACSARRFSLWKRRRSRARSSSYTRGYGGKCRCDSGIHAKSAAISSAAAITLFDCTEAAARFFETWLSLPEPPCCHSPERFARLPPVSWSLFSHHTELFFGSLSISHSPQCRLITQLTCMRLMSVLAALHEPAIVTLHTNR